MAQRLKSVQSKLGNEKFTGRAPAQVVQREKDLEASLQETLAKIEAQIAGLERS